MVAAGWLVASWMGAEAKVRALVGREEGPCGSWGKKKMWFGRSVGEQKWALRLVTRRLKSEF